MKWRFLLVASNSFRGCVCFDLIEVRKAETKHRKHGRQNMPKLRVDCFVLVLAYKLAS